MPRIELERFEEDRDEDRENVARESFDRIAFAERLVSLVRPRRTTVAICDGGRRVALESGRRWGGAPDERWAVLWVPPHASRRSIAAAVLALAADDPGRWRDPPPSHAPYRAWSLDVILEACNDPATDRR